MIHAIAHQNEGEIGKLLYNDLEKVVLPEHPKVTAVKEQFLSLQPLGAMMSGSGPTVFALTKTLEQAQHIEQQMRQAFPDPDLELWVTQFNTHGIRVMD